MARLRLSRVCQARSGDKADIANIAVFASSARIYPLLKQQLTAERVAAHLRPLVRGEVTRYEVPNVLALNFVCTHALGGGGPSTLRSDILGKTLGANLLRFELDVPDELIDALELDDAPPQVHCLP